MNNTATADGIAYRLVRELEDLIELAGTAMRQANADGSEYEVEDELASARLAVESYKTFCGETKGGYNYRVKYWRWINEQAGEWCRTGLMTQESAEKVAESFRQSHEQVEVYFDDDGR